MMVSLLQSHTISLPEWVIFVRSRVQMVTQSPGPGGSYHVGAGSDESVVSHEESGSYRQTARIQDTHNGGG